MTIQPSVLTEIINLKKERLRRLTPAAEELRRAALAARENNSRAHLFRRSLSGEESIKIIAEFKRASPSKGNISGEADPVATARAYEAGGAAAISVLTEEDKFLGSPADLSAVRAATHLPVLRKDFIFAVEQIYETALMGADALLLIVAALDDATLISLRHLTEDELGLDALVEVHTAEEMRRARNCGARLIGVNNRDLHTFRVSLDTSVALAALAPPGVTLISESGLQTFADLRRLRDVGYGGFLIGENLMRAADPAAALRSLLGREAS